MQLLAEILQEAGDPARLPMVMLALGGLGLYIAARVGTHALVGPRGFGGAAAGAIALGHWVPTAAVALTAVVAGPADVALGVTFATSVAAVSLAVGMTVFLVPSEPLPASRRAWPFLLPAALLVVVAGFGGALNLIHALMLAGLGLAVLGVWRGTAADDPAAAGDLLAAVHGTGPQAAGGRAADAAPAYEVAGDPPRPDHARAWRMLQWALAAGLAVVAARAAVVGTIRTDATSLYLRAGILAAGAVSPLLVLPLLAVGTDLAQRNRSGEACSACVGLALLNQLVLLPLVVVSWIAQSLWQTGWPRGGSDYGSARAAWYQPLSDAFMKVPSVPLPLSAWRIDSVVLVVLGFALLPAALGKWRLGRLEAVALIVGYAAYLAASAFLAVRTR